ncbi:histidine kinase [Neisseria sp.]|uniref:histidine kinase n=1 Tax=Neisseria sp. TaxID=192066 RepID=UPI0035A19AB8
MTQNRRPFSRTGLPFRLKLLTAVWGGAALVSIAFTLLLSRQLEGAGEAINDAGSLRMRIYRMTYMAARGGNAAETRSQMSLFDKTLNAVRDSRPHKPLLLPAEPEVEMSMQRMGQGWYRHIRPYFAYNSLPSESELRLFAADIDRFVQALEKVNARNTRRLRLFQTALAVMVVVGAVLMILLLNYWVIRPLESLRLGVETIRKGGFGAVIDAGRTKEFAQVGEGFNHMSAELKTLYTDLEGQVARQTQDLARKNRESDLLYRTARALHQSHTPAEAAQTFLQLVLPEMSAAAGSVRLIDSERRRTDLVAQTGLPEDFADGGCYRPENCLCACETDGGGTADFQTVSLPEPLRRAGFTAASAFPVTYQNDELGVFTLYFSDGAALKETDRSLLQALGTQLGVSIANSRLVQSSRQLAVLQERNLIAQGLHDSIAQTLTFLNLQVQMLESASKAGNGAGAEENLAALKNGIQECYEDVRELLLNFRTKISSKDFPEAVAAVVRRFESQTGIPADTVWQGSGLPLNEEQQLQAIFILQESLSNIRKHARATRVSVVIDDGADFTVTIRDNGRGFDTGRLKTLPDRHVGLSIMHERARRIRARLTVESRPTNGTAVTLVLPQTERTAS